MSVIRKDKNIYHSAAGLVEVLIVLGIVAVIMVIIGTLTVQSYLRIKDNEMLDYANGIMIRALEITKTPSEILVHDPSGFIGYDGSYTIDLGAVPRALRRQSLLSNPITSCNTDSVYLIDVSNEFPGISVPTICLQLIIQSEGDSRYIVEVNMIYKSSNQEITNSLLGYRVNEFITIE